MQKKFLKIFFIIFILLIFVLGVTTKATSDTNAESDVVIGGDEDQTDEPTATSENDEETPTESEETEENEDSSENNEGDDETPSEVENTVTNTVENETDKSVSTYIPPETSVPTSSYSTVASIPEANLTLNNILNVILIAVGVIIVLLAIAILIRLK